MNAPKRLIRFSQCRCLADQHVYRHVFHQGPPHQAIVMAAPMEGPGLGGRIASHNAIEQSLGPIVLPGALPPAPYRAWHFSDLTGPDGDVCS